MMDQKDYERVARAIDIFFDSDQADQQKSFAKFMAFILGRQGNPAFDARAFVRRATATSNQTQSEGA